MKSINKSIICGGLAKPAVIRYDKNGNPVASFSVGIDESYTDRKTKELVKKTEWINVSVFGKQAEYCKKLDKGSRVLVEGRIKTDKVTSADGSTKFYTKVQAEHVTFLNVDIGDMVSTTKAPEVKKYQNAADPSSDMDDFNDDIPF